MTVLKSGWVSILSKVAFKKIWKSYILYILQDENSYTFAAMDNITNVDEISLTGDLLKNNPNVKIMKKINGNTIFKIGTTQPPSKKNQILRYSFIIEFNLYNKVEVSVDTLEGLKEWQTCITSVIDKLGKVNTFHPLEAIKAMLSKTFGKKRHISTSYSLRNINYRYGVQPVPQTKFHVYCINTDTPTVQFSNIYHAMIEFTEFEVVLSYSRQNSTSVTLRWNYSDIKRYGISKNTFCIEVVTTKYDSELESDETHMSYFFTVDKEKDLEQVFRTYVQYPPRAIPLNLNESHVSDEEANDKNVPTLTQVATESTKEDSRCKTELQVNENIPPDQHHLITTPLSLEYKNQDLLNDSMVTSVVVKGSRELNHYMVEISPEDNISAIDSLSNDTSGSRKPFQRKINGSIKPLSTFKPSESTQGNPPVSVVKEIAKFYENAARENASHDFFRCKSDAEIHVTTYVYYPTQLHNHFTISNANHTESDVGKII